MTENVFLHYFNANAEERLPHTLDFGPIQGRLVTSDNVVGQVVTVVGIGMPRRYYIWSSFIADKKSEEREGKCVIHGEGWHLCPPQGISEKIVSLLTEKRLSDHLFIHVVNPRVAAWLLKKADAYKPPGEPQQIRAFLKKLLSNIVDEKIEAKIKAALKATQSSQHLEARWTKR